MTIRIVSLGDSFTEGLGDVWPDGQERGWADRVAVALAAARPDEEVLYANLAIRGRLIGRIIDEQLPAALALDPKPTHLTFNGGGNDMLRPGFGLARLRALTEGVLDACADAGVFAVILSGPVPSEHLPAGKRMLTLGGALCDEVADLVSGRKGALFVDNFSDVEARRPLYWSEDRLHLNSLGHARVAARVLQELDVAADFPDVAGAAPPLTGGRAELAYWRAHVLPWIGRRVRGKSSGDGRDPKYPAWVRVGQERPWQSASAPHA